MTRWTFLDVGILLYSVQHVIFQEGAGAAGYTVLSKDATGQFRTRLFSPGDFFLLEAPVVQLSSRSTPIPTWQFGICWVISPHMHGSSTGNYIRN